MTHCKASMSIRATMPSDFSSRTREDSATSTADQKSLHHASQAPSGTSDRKAALETISC